MIGYRSCKEISDVPEVPGGAVMSRLSRLGGKGVVLLKCDKYGKTVSLFMAECRDALILDIFSFILC